MEALQHRTCVIRLAVKAVASYLTKYAEPEAGMVRDLAWSGQPFDKAVVIPAFDEAAALPHAIASIRRAAGGREALVIAVVNAATDSPEAVHLENQKCVAGTWPQVIPFLRDPLNTGDDEFGVPRCFFFVDQYSGPTLLINRFTRAHLLPEKEGVGLARKIGADVALSLFECGVLKTSLLHMTDADVQVPIDYFLRSKAMQPNSLSHSPLEASAYIFPFEHMPPSGQSHLGDGLLVYELFLREYEAGLNLATSAYAFQTIGSLLLINLEKYAAVRGFPRRQAAEDFYLLNKLAKVGRVDTLIGEPVQITERHSVRVPFGTGAATMKLEHEPFDQPIYYAKSAYIELQRILSAMNELADGVGADFATVSQALSNAGATTGTEALIKLGFVNAITAIFSNYSTPALRHRHLREWFDAFRTMRWIHLVSEQAYPRLSARQHYSPKAADVECRNVLRKRVNEMRQAAFAGSVA